jgi:hypothetical protein
MRIHASAAAIFVCGLAALQGCATHTNTAPSQVSTPSKPTATPPSTTISADQSNSQLLAALTREFPLGSPRAAVVEHADRLGMQRVRQARVVDEQGREVSIKDAHPGLIDFASRGWRVENVDSPDQTVMAFQLSASSPQSAADSRALMFVFGSDRRLQGISVSPAMGSRPTRVVHEGFTIGDPRQGGKR